MSLYSPVAAAAKSAGRDKAEPAHFLSGGGGECEAAAKASGEQQAEYNECTHIHLRTDQAI